ncbi:MAG: hypothetical protein JJE04_20445, partial [Acidobacteriia bacterium]|nr:hypothetical protein [Terriglobia bacterium]
MKLLSLLLLLLTTSATAQTDAILADLSEITGLRLLRPVKQERMNRSQLKEFFEQRIQEVVKPEELRVEELTLKKFGFIPADFDLKKTTIDLLTEQAAAFYDYRKKKMVLMDGGGDAMQQAALVHELAHALADQHFNLEKYLTKGSSSDDASMARTAVMEGQATWLMSEQMAKRLGQSLVDAPLLVEAMSRMAANSGAAFPVFEKVPLYMKESLVFPYSKGMLFQQAVVKKMGKQGFQEVFRRPPFTTQEILHPEKYFDRVVPEKVLPPTPAGKNWKELVDGTIGEFDHGILLQQYSDNDAGLEVSWRGGRYRIWEHKKTKRSVLGYATAWESEAAAAKMMQAYRRVLQGKWKKFSVSSESETRIS